MAATRFGAESTAKMNNWAGTVAPGVTDDNTAGYGVGSLWLDTVAAKVYLAKSVGTGAASWIDLCAAFAGVLVDEEYAVANGTPDRTIDMTSTTIDELANVVAALILDLQTGNIIS